MKLQKEKPETAAFANALKFNQDGSSVILSLAIPVNELIEIVKADAARKEAQKQKKRQAESETK